jgi:PAS domain S-box-containing protein
MTEIKEYEAKLAAERDFLHSVIESIPDPFYVIDTDDYTIQYANSEAIAESGTTCYEATHGRENPCDEGDDTAPCPLSEVRETREPTTVEHTHTDEAGNERVFRIHSSPIFDDEGNPVWMAESNIDITDRVEYERELESQRDNLEMLNRVVRHDIRNDMTVVNGRANLLEAHVEESGQEDLAAIQRATENAIELTKTARDLSETMLSTEEDVEPVGLAHHLEAPIENARSTFEHALITVEDRIPDVEVPGNELLEAVFRNLIQNAIVHNDKEAPKVHVSTSRREETVTIAIADNGPGIPDEQKEQIFGKGEKGLDSPGTGIGLYLVETLVEQYGGEVWVEDRGDTEAAPDSWGDEDDPEGSVFYVELPRFA